MTGASKRRTNAVNAERPGGNICQTRSSVERVEKVERRVAKVEREEKIRKAENEKYTEHILYTELTDI